MRRHWLLLLIGALTLASAIPSLMGGAGMLDTLGRLSWWGILLLPLMILAGWNLNAVRLRLMLHDRALNLGQGKALATIMATECVFNATPGGSGAPFALAGLLRRHGVSGSTATAVFAVDQLTDMVVFLILIPVLFFHGLGKYLELGSVWQAFLPVVLLVAGLLAVWVLMRHDRTVIRRTGRLLARLNVSQGKRRAWARHALRFRRAVDDTLTLPKSHLLALFLLCALYWLLRCSVLFVAVQAMGGDLAWVYGFFVQVVAMGAGHLTLLPGGAGGSELAGAALLGPWMGTSMTAAAILVWRLTTFHFYLLAGGLVMLFLIGRESLVWLRGE